MYRHKNLRILEEVHKIVMSERAKWFVSPERLAWILKTYPPDETGRPGILAFSNIKAASQGKDVGELELVEEEGGGFWRPK